MKNENLQLDSQYTTLEEFQNIAGVNMNTILKKSNKIPGIEKDDNGNYRVLRGTRYPVNMRHFSSNDFGKKRYQLLKAICENKYIDEKKLRCDITQFDRLLNELAQMGYIRKNNLFNHFGANDYDPTQSGENEFYYRKALKSSQHFITIAQGVGATAGAFAATYNNLSA